MAKKLTKKEVGQAITMEVRYFLETLGFDDEDDQGRYITFFDAALILFMIGMEKN